MGKAYKRMRSEEGKNRDDTKRRIKIYIKRRKGERDTRIRSSCGGDVRGGWRRGNKADKRKEVDMTAWISVPENNEVKILICKKDEV